MPGTGCSCDWQRELFVDDAARPRRVLAVEGNEPAWRKAMSEPPHSYCDLTIETTFAASSCVHLSRRVRIAYPLAGQPYGLSSRSRSVYSCSRPNHGCMHR